MTTATTNVQLTSKNVSDLNDLIEINLDSEKGFRETREKLTTPDHQQMFSDIADDRHRQAEELKSLVSASGHTPERDGSLAGKAHRWWISVRDKVGSSSDHDVLAEAERGEDKILELYREVTERSTDDPGLAVVLQDHLSRVKAQHDRVRNLRDASKHAEAHR